MINPLRARAEPLGANGKPCICTLTTAPGLPGRHWKDRCAYASFNIGHVKAVIW